MSEIVGKKPCKRCGVFCWENENECPHCGETRTSAAPDSSVPTTDAKSQGQCDTTMTERFDVGGCNCPTYEGNLGPCATYLGGSNERCVYCDHTKQCHARVPTTAPAAATETAWLGEIKAALRNAQLIREFFAMPDENVYRKRADGICVVLEAMLAKELGSETPRPMGVVSEETGNEQLARELAERLQILYGYQVGLNDLIPALLDVLEDWNVPREKENQPAPRPMEQQRTPTGDDGEVKFEQWWSSQGANPQPTSLKPSVLELAFKEVANRAWHAGRYCAPVSSPATTATEEKKQFAFDLAWDIADLIDACTAAPSVHEIQTIIEQALSRLPLSPQPSATDEQRQE